MFKSLTSVFSLLYGYFFSMILGCFIFLFSNGCLFNYNDLWYLLLFSSHCLSISYHELWWSKCMFAFLPLPLHFNWLLYLKIISLLLSLSALRTAGLWLSKKRKVTHRQHFPPSYCALLPAFPNWPFLHWKSLQGFVLQS